MSSIAGGCEYIITPEQPWSKEELIESLQNGIAKGKKHAIITLTELMMDANDLAKDIEQATVEKQERQFLVIFNVVVVLQRLTVS